MHHVIEGKKFWKLYNLSTFLSNRTENSWGKMLVSETFLSGNIYVNIFLLLFFVKDFHLSRYSCLIAE